MLFSNQAPRIGKQSMKDVFQLWQAINSVVGSISCIVGVRVTTRIVYEHDFQNTASSAY